ncbi:hypothetical protein ILP97_11520 [Amycolatopsis sp. H6(2020)]|nr:hypothetical protein [Amycolatopsis sp. H6(2020)]
MTTVAYPLTRPGPAWFVVSYGEDLIGIVLDNIEAVYPTEDQAHAWLARNSHADADIVRVDVLWSAHCVVCGDKPDLPPPGQYRSWDELRDYLRSEPGWTCTSEQLVFCPNHRPSREE